MSCCKYDGKPFNTADKQQQQILSDRDTAAYVTACSVGALRMKKN